MSIQRKPANVVKDIVRRAVPKKQPRRPKPNRDGFPKQVKDIASGRSGGRCEIDDCGPACVYHHRGPRSLGGTREGWVNRAANSLHLADACHLRIESNRTRSYMNGWLVSRVATLTADQVPVLYRGGWVLLDDDGGVRAVEGDAA